jgi:aminoglycoside phosphotransferase (APT) family kinase protein
MRLLHDGQIGVTTAMVKTLIEKQFPQYKNVPVNEFDTTGTVNAIFRLGNKRYVRLPMLEIYADSILKEYKILPYLSEKLTLAIPHPIYLGIPDTVYPFHWGIYTWIDGDSYDHNKITDAHEIIDELANFVKELHSIDLSADAPKAGRRPLADLNLTTIDALNNAKDAIEYKKAVSIWNYLVNTPVWDNKPVWIHGDLLKPNILIKNNRIAGIIDFGSAGIGDPAFDIIPAWTIFETKSRSIFREKLNVDDALWNRACAYALHQAALIIPYYRETNKIFAEQAVNTINEIIKDTSGK